MTTTGTPFSIFVNSAFRFLKAERNALQRAFSPLCASHVSNTKAVQ
jgi:hypothetical protein